MSVRKVAAGMAFLVMACSAYKATAFPLRNKSKNRKSSSPSDPLLDEISKIGKKSDDLAKLLGHMYFTSGLSQKERKTLVDFVKNKGMTFTQLHEFVETHDGDFERAARKIHEWTPQIESIRSRVGKLKTESVPSSELGDAHEIVVKVIQAEPKTAERVIRALESNVIDLGSVVRTYDNNSKSYDLTNRALFNQISQISSFDPSPRIR